jgi:ubiquinone/menaquinone biosynthesis C-methylase UbiE
LLARIMSAGGPRYEGLVSHRKQQLFTLAQGSVLEIGAGTGPNLRYLPAVDRYLACEPNPYMHPLLGEEIERHGIAGSIDARPAEQLLRETEDASVDTVVCTLVLCSVDSPEKLLAGIRRVLKPGGRLLLLEHVSAPKGAALRVCQHLVSPVFRCLADGCRPTRDTIQSVRSAGFSRVEMEEFSLPLGPISPHLCGWASK